MMWILFDTPSSYRIDAKASRGRARFFMRHPADFEQPARTHDPSPITRTPHAACHTITAPLHTTS